MRTESVRTKLDGVQPLIWMDEVDFKGRTTRIYSGENFDSVVLEEVISIPDYLVLCDFCNERIELYPVPVLHGHALCPQCYKALIV